MPDIPQKLRHWNDWDKSKLLWRRVLTRVCVYKQVKSPLRGGDM